MKKRSFGLVVLLSLLIIVIIFYAVISNAMKDDEKGGTGSEDGEKVYIDKQADDVVKLTYRTGGSEFTVQKSGSIYVLAEDEDFPLDTTAVKFMLNAAAQISYQRRINPEGNDLSEYGLTDPQAVIDISYDDGARLTLTVGNYNAYSEAYYCTTGDGFVYLIGGQFSEAFSYKYADLILHDRVTTPQYGFSSVTKIEITSGNKRAFYELVGEEDGVWMKNGESGEFTYEAMNIYNELYKLNPNDWVAYNVETEEGFDSFGLKTPDIRIVFTHTEIEVIENDGSSAVEKTHERQTAFLIGSPTDEGDENDVKRYFAFGGGSIIYIMHESDFANTMNAVK